MWRNKRKAVMKELKEQFEIDLKAFNATGLERKSTLDIEINEDIRKKAKALKRARWGHGKELYTVECINEDICPACGENIEEVSCPKRPGCWAIMKKCTKCTWQLMLEDLSID